MSLAWYVCPEEVPERHLGEYFQSLSIDQPPQETVPYQLQSFVSSRSLGHRFWIDFGAQISSAAWQARLRAVLRKGGRYLKPGFDAVWGIITFMYVMYPNLHARRLKVNRYLHSATFAVPIALYFVALNVLPHKNEVRDGFDFWPYGWDDDGRYWKARGISIATFFGVILLTWGPMLAWKLYVCSFCGCTYCAQLHVLTPTQGKSQVNKMLKKFEAEDRAVRGPGAAVPTYRIKMPGIYSRHLVYNFLWSSYGL